ncbi:MAG: regulatory particle non-ATPase [Thelocarpon superellum]|nr:MAG: regulatory particle non-ATPase [Thelocarpon superellum]
MDSHHVDDYAVALRQELKVWEQSFSAANGGRKAGRDDIKKVPTIAAKYKEYTRLRETPSTKHQAPAQVRGAAPPTESASPSEHRSRKRKSTHEVREGGFRTPSKRSKTASIPQKQYVASPDQYDSPSVLRTITNTPTRRATIGPTPQKDGQILGLFDLLEDAPAGPVPTPFVHLESVTPSKQDHNVSTSPAHRTRTPASSGKRFLLDSFVTPAKRKANDMTTPSRSASNMLFSTPAFLRRGSQRPHPLQTLNEEGSESPGMYLPPKPSTKGLSSMLASLRRMEDDRLDEEWDVMREMEMENEGSTTRGAQKGDEENADDEEAGEGLGRGGKPLKIWKKKGQKRTTRRFILRPVQQKASKPAKTVTTRSRYDPDGDGVGGENHDAHDDTTDDDELQAERSANMEKDARLIAAEMNRTGATLRHDTHEGEEDRPPDGETEKKEGEGMREKIKRKIKATAHSHMNFRRLKIRGNGSASASASARGRGRGRRR